jgi:hypothetical protein
MRADQSERVRHLSRRRRGKNGCHLAMIHPRV